MDQMIPKNMENGLSSSEIFTESLPNSVEIANFNSPPKQETNLGFLLNRETGELFCKFNRDVVPGAFASFTKRTTIATDTQLQMYDSIRDCSNEENLIAESFAEGFREKNKVAAIHGVFIAGICVVGFLNGAIRGLDTLMPNDTEVAPEPPALLENVGYQSATYYGYHYYHYQNAKQLRLFTAFKQILKLNIYCEVAGTAAGLAAAGIAYAVAD